MWHSALATTFIRTSHALGASTVTFSTFKGSLGAYATAARQTSGSALVEKRWLRHLPIQSDRKEYRIELLMKELVIAAKLKLLVVLMTQELYLQS